MSGRWFHKTLAAALVALTVAGSAFAAPVPPKLALLLMLKVLTYDHSFPSRGTGDFVVLVAKEPGGHIDDVMAAAGQLGLDTILSRPLRFTTIDFKGPGDLEAAVDKVHASAIATPEGTSEAGLRAVTDVAGKKKLYTLGLDPNSAEHGLVLGVGEHDGKPQIVINLAGAKKAGAEFAPAILKLARLIE